MTEEQLRQILGDLKGGSLSEDQAVERLRNLPFEDLGFANVDHHRGLRQGFPEVIFGAGKSAEQVAGIVQAMRNSHHNILITRANKEQFARVRELLPDAEFHESSRTIVVRRDETLRGKGTVMVISAGTSDMPVAEEALITLKVMGNTVDSLYDVGVAGLHRLLDRRDRLCQARVV